MCQTTIHFWRICWYHQILWQAVCHLVMHLKATTEDPLFAHFFYQSPKPVSLINIWSEYFIVITLLKSSAISKYKHYLKTKDPLLTDILEYWFLSHDNTVCGKHVHSIIARISFFLQDNIVYPLFFSNTPTTKFE